jgi:hypothetical protein
MEREREICHVARRQIYTNTFALHSCLSTAGIDPATVGTIAETLMQSAILTPVPEAARPARPNTEKHELTTLGQLGDKAGNMDIKASETKTAAEDHTLVHAENQKCNNKFKL